MLSLAELRLVLLIAGTTVLLASASVCVYDALWGRWPT